MAERRVCRVLEQQRLTLGYVVKIPDDEAALIRQMHELVRRHPRRGYRLVWAMLRREGWRSLNRKRVHWLWRREGFKVPQKHKKMRLKGSGEGGGGS